MTKASVNDSDNNDTFNNNNHTVDGEIINSEQFEDMRDLLEEDFIELVQTYLTDSKQRIITLRAAQVAMTMPLALMQLTPSKAPVLT